MSTADVLLAVGAIPAAYAGYWMTAGLFMLLGQARPVTVSLRVGGPYILLAWLLLAASLVGVVLTITS